MNDTQKKKADQLWKQLEAEGSAWQRRLGTGSMVIPLYELRRYWSELVNIDDTPEQILEKQTREFEVARLRAEVERYRKMLALAVTRSPAKVTELSTARAKKANETPAWPLLSNTPRTRE